MEEAKLAAAAIFAGCYLLLVFRKGNPLAVVWAGAALLVANGVLSFPEALSSINLNVLGVMAGTMVLSELFIRSRVPAFLATAVAGRAGTAGLAMVGVCVLAGAISSVVENVATVFIVAPVALEVAGVLGLSPVPFLVGIAVSANLEGTATMIGDSPSLLLASALRLTFNDFFWRAGRPGIFFAVQAGALASFTVLYLMFCRYRHPVRRVRRPAVRSVVPVLLIGGLVVSLAGSSFIPDRPPWTAGAISLAWGLAGLAWSRRKPAFRIRLCRDLDWVTPAFLAGIFVLIHSLTSTGVIADLASLIVQASGGSAFGTYTTFVWFSVLASAFIDNIPYSMAMLPAALLAADALGVRPELFCFGLLSGATLGGNITPIGACANVAAVGILRRQGYPVTFGHFARIGIPFTIAAVTASYLFLWLTWGPGAGWQ